MLGLKDVSATEIRAAYKTVPAVSVKLYGGKPEAYDTTAPDFLCMDYDQAKHALTHGHAAVMTPDVWVTVRQAVEVAA
jgi:hypothetical protein